VNLSVLGLKMGFFHFEIFIYFEGYVTDEWTQSGIFLEDLNFSHVARVGFLAIF
jgi:hypothetical protein